MASRLAIAAIAALVIVAIVVYARSNGGNTPSPPPPASCYSWVAVNVKDKVLPPKVAGDLGGHRLPAIAYSGDDKKWIFGQVLRDDPSLWGAVSGLYPDGTAAKTVSPRPEQMWFLVPSDHPACKGADTLSKTTDSKATPAFNGTGVCWNFGTSQQGTDPKDYSTFLPVNSDGTCGKWIYGTFDPVADKKPTSV